MSRPLPTRGYYPTAPEWRNSAPGILAAGRTILGRDLATI
jgi:hypothetical protein